MKRKIMIPGLAIFVMLGISIATLSVVYAQETSSNYPPVVERLATKFNLNPDEVQEVFDELRDEHMANRYAEFAERLDDLVQKGKITEDQKQKILDKYEEMQGKLEEARTLDAEARRVRMLEIHEEFRSWARKNNLDLPQMSFMSGMHTGLGRSRHAQSN